MTSTARALGISKSALIERMIQKTEFPDKKIQQILKLQEEAKRELKRK